MIWPEHEDNEVLTWESLDIDFELENAEILREWLENVASQYDKTIRNIHYIFSSDSYMLDLNKSTLNHDFYTDIITFPLEEGDICEAEAVISIDRVRENAENAGIPFLKELHRVMIHAVLHLFGINDESEDEQKEMRKAEDEALALLSTLLKN